MIGDYANINKEQIVDILLQQFITESDRLSQIEMPNLYSEKRAFLRGLFNIRPPMPVGSNLLELQDILLSKEMEENEFFLAKNIKTVAEVFPSSKVSYADRICLWQGDITTLKIDGIVNAANSKMLGCFVPGHSCIDNAIHSVAGVQLRLACDEIMNQQGYDEPTGTAKITKGYNLPCSYVIHTVGPIIIDKPTSTQEKELVDCYCSCLDLATKHNLTSIAFCCISTGEFHFPKDRAAQIAIQSVIEFLHNNKTTLQKVIFNVFTQEDYYVYRKILG